MYRRFTKTKAAAESSGIMENRDHLKNGAIPKSRTSKGKQMLIGG